MIAIFVLSSITIITYGTKYPRMDQRKFVEDSLKNMKWYGLFKQIISLQIC